MGGKRWTESEVAYLVEHYPHRPTADIASHLGISQSRAHHKADSLGLRKTPEYFRTHVAGRFDGIRGAEKRFKPGQEPWNKGKPFPATGRTKETQFKPGNKPQTWNPIGHERITRDGYLERKMTDTGVTRRDYVAVHRMIWEEHNGPIPDGHIVIFRDKDPKNLVIENLEMISREENARRNTIHRYPREITDAIRQVNGLRRRIKNIEKKRSAA